MKRLMLGNEAIARGLYEAGCELVSSYPGTPSTEITEFAAKYAEKANDIVQKMLDNLVFDGNLHTNDCFFSHHTRDYWQLCDKRNYL